MDRQPKKKHHLLYYYLHNSFRTRRDPQEPKVYEQKESYQGQGALPTRPPSCIRGLQTPIASKHRSSHRGGLKGLSSPPSDPPPRLLLCFPHAFRWLKKDDGSGAAESRETREGKWKQGRRWEGRP
ncbi:hypothetical protein B296_00052490, partial [Ensete ventricosum]